MTYDFDRIIERHGTDSIKWDRTSKNEIPMFIADMDFGSAPAVEKRIRERLEHPVFGYTSSDDRLISAFIDWFDEEYGFRIQKEWVTVINGIVPALSVLSDLEEGSSISVTPNYHMLLEAPGKAGNRMITVPLKNTSEYYEFDFEALDNAIEDDTHLFYLCNPQNPVGRIYTVEELEEVSRFASKHNLIVISDEIHCEIVFDRKHTPYLTVNSDALNNSVSLYAPGKICNIPGVSLAFAVIPNEALRKKFKKLTYAMGHPGIFNIEAAIAAYSESREWKKELVSYLRSNRDYLYDELRKRFPNAGFTHTEATYLQWVNFGEGIDSELIRKKAGVVLTDGESFGGKGYVRINFGCPREILREAIERLDRALNEHENA